MPEHSVVPLADASFSFCSYLLKFKFYSTSSDAGVAQKLDGLKTDDDVDR